MDAKSLLFRMLLKRVLKRTALGAAVAWAVFAWATGKIDPAGGMAKVYSVVAEKVGRKGGSTFEPAPQQDVAATRAAATVKAAGIAPGSKPGAVGGYSANDVLCLAHAVYYEARNDSRELQIAVAQVALNRALSTTGQKSICRIIYLGLGRPMGCLFSQTCRNLGTIPDDESRWKASIEVAQDVAAGKAQLPAYEFATHFNSSAIRPSWVSTVYKLRTQGRFTFYSTRPVEDPADVAAATAGTGRAGKALPEENAAVAARRKAANLPRSVSLPKPSALGATAATPLPQRAERAERAERTERAEPPARSRAEPKRSPFGDTFN